MINSMQRPARFPVLRLLNPYQYVWLVLLTLVAGVATGWAAMHFWQWKLWQATALMLGLLLIPGVAKWRVDLRQRGRVGMVMSILLVTQGFHTVEHVVQWVQNHVLRWETRASTGLLSPANSEWVHFVWNWLVLLTVAWLVFAGLRNRWAWLLLVWAMAHTFEHSYLLLRYLDVRSQLQDFGATSVTAQGLAGILGRDGWLARSEVTQASFVCRLPGITTATRLDVHFWWNVGEIVLFCLAAHVFLRRQQLATNATKA